MKRSLTKEYCIDLAKKFNSKGELIVIEFDERLHYHSSKYKDSDPIRQKMIEDIGFTVIRFTEDDLLEYLVHNDKEYLLK